MIEPWDLYLYTGLAIIWTANLIGWELWPGRYMFMQSVVSLLLTLTLLGGIQ